MIFFSYFVAIASLRFGVSAYIPTTVGQENVIPPYEIASTPVWQAYSPRPFSHPIPSSHPGYEVTNIGNTEVRASIYWKDSWPLQLLDVFCETRLNCSTNSSVNVWYELGDPVHIKPFESAVIRPPTKANFYFTRLVVVSNYDENSVNLKTTVNVKYENEGISPAEGRQEIIENSKWSVCDNVKMVFKLGGSKLPGAMDVSGLEALIELFWPENETSVWDEVLHQIRYLIDRETFDTINALLTGPMVAFKQKLVHLAQQLNKHQSDVSVFYMNLAKDFIGLEEESIIHGHYNAEKLNEDLLPVYSNIVLMKAAFYSLGMKCQKRVGLSQQNLAKLQTYFTDMIRSPLRGANQRISQIFKNQCLKPFEYSKVMHMRNKINEHGYIPIWNNLLDHPQQKLIVNEIFYSDFKGVFYASKDVSPPLNDPLTSGGLSNGEYNELRKLIVFESSSNCSFNCCADTIVGMKLIFKNGAMSEFGEITSAYRTVELNDTYRIGEIETKSNELFVGATANIRIRLLKFDQNEWKNSTMGEYSFGCSSSNSLHKKYTFTKENHYIASIYAYFDGPSRRSDLYPLWRMGVSFLPLKSQLDHIDEEDWKVWTC